jgi:outer membrane protein
MIIIVSLMLPHRAFAWGFEAAAGYWMQHPNGNVAFNGNGLLGSNLDLGLDLQFNTRYQPYVWAKVEFPWYLPNIYLMATPMKFDGTGQKNVSFTFGGHTFQANIPFESKLKMDHYDLTFYYSIPFLKRITNDVLNVELGLDARAMDFEANINQTTTGSSAQKSLWTVLPLGYGSIQIYPAKIIGFEAEFKGIFYGANNYIDIIGKIKILPYGPIEISVGYRYESLKADFGGDFKGNITINGPFVEAGVKF